MIGQRDGERTYTAPASLYIHVPVCASKCSYCDFFSSPASALSEGFEARLVSATLERARALAERFEAKAFETVYVGGGTPTLLSSEGLDALLRGVASLAKGSGDSTPREWTVEANPDSLGPEALGIMKERGVTRLSVGVQSLDADELAVLGRRHGPEAALSAIRLAAGCGLDVSADLIAGAPTRARGPSSFDAGRLAEAAAELLAAGVGHISVYDLTIEEGTPLASTQGQYLFPDEDEDWGSRERLEALLAASGLRRYEVSNYAAVGRECLHNLSYWHMDSYIGAGPGAVSTLVSGAGSSLRIEEAKDIEGYGSRAGASAKESLVGLRDSAFESMMMAFRTSFGLDLEAFRKRFGMDAGLVLEESLSAWRSHLRPGEPWPGRRNNPGIALDGSGLNLLNRFLVDCMGEIERKIPL